MNTFIRAMTIGFFCLTCHSANWNQFRGPGGSGINASHPAPTEWSVPENKNVLWKTQIRGLSHASPIIWGDRIYLITAVSASKAELKVGLYGDIQPANDREEQQWRLIALDRNTGKIIWDELGRISIPRSQRHTKASHANSTPVTDGENIVAIFGSEGLYCYNNVGILLWKKSLGPMDAGFFNIPAAQWGFGSSPIIHDGKVIVQCDVQTNSFITAIDLKTGEEVWKTPRREVPTWSTPTIATTGAQKIILANGWHQIAAYDFKSGAQIWTLDGGGDIPVPTPIVSGQLAYFTSAHGSFRPMRAIRLDSKGDISPASVGDTNSAIVWVHARAGNYMQTPIVLGDNLYACNDNGILTCFDAKSGKIHFSERLTRGNEGFTASPVSDTRHIYFPSENGNVFVVHANGHFNITATNKLGETCMATPALADGVLYFRTRDHLIAIGK